MKWFLAVILAVAGFLMFGPWVAVGSAVLYLALSKSETLLRPQDATSYNAAVTTATLGLALQLNIYYAWHSLSKYEFAIKGMAVCFGTILLAIPLQAVFTVLAWVYEELLVPVGKFLVWIAGKTKRVTYDRQQQHTSDGQRRRKLICQAGVEKYFDDNEHLLGGHYSRAKMEAFMQKHMSDDHDADFVESQGNALLENLRRCVERMDPTTRERQQKEQEEATKALSTLERDAAVVELRKFCTDHRTDLQPFYPFSLLEAFIHSEMHEGVSGTEAWRVCGAKIDDLQKQMDSRRKEAERRANATGPSAEELQQKIQEMLDDGMSAEAVAEELANKLSGQSINPNNL